MQTLNNGRAVIEHALGGLKVTIPSKKNWFVLIFATLWLGGWAMGFLSVTQELGEGGGSGTGFLTMWLIGWTAGGAMVLFLLFWGFFGKEILEISSGNLHFEKSVFGIGIKKELMLSEVKNFRTEKISSGFYGGNRWAFWGLGPGRVKFDYGLKTYSFGLAVDEAEAEYLAEILSQKIVK